MLATLITVQSGTFAVAAVICVFGALGTVFLSNPVHNALSLVATLFGVAVLFVAQEAYFLAVIQVIVYAGAIVVLFLFVIMLLGVDTVRKFAVERSTLTLAVGGIAGALISGLTLLAVLTGSHGTVTGTRNSLGPNGALDATRDVNVLGQQLFTTYVFAFEITSVLLVIAVVGAVVLSRRPKGEVIDLDEFPEIVVEVDPDSSLESDQQFEPDASANAGQS